MVNALTPTFTLICRGGFFIVNFRKKEKLSRSTVAQLIVANFFYFLIFFISHVDPLFSFTVHSEIFALNLNML